MNTMKWLVRREIWEHKGMFFWAPIVTAGLILLAALAGSWAASSHGKINGVRLTVNGQDVETRVSALPPEMGEQVGSALATGYLGPVIPLLALMTIGLFFYCIGSLYDERRDRSILFWKSLPVSDRDTVLSKFATATLVVPLFYLAVGIALSIAILLVTSVVVYGFTGFNILPYVLSNSAAYTSPLFLVGLLPVYVVWALPTIGWLMLVSSWARSKVIIWAVGAPLIALVLVNYAQFLADGALHIDWLTRHVIPRSLVGLAPGTWIGFADLDLEHMIEPGSHMISASRLFTASWGTLLSPAALGGAAAGVAMIAASVRMRRWRDEG